MVVLTAACLVLGWWQIDRARGGNALSFGYAIEWPAFAIFVVFVWYREIRNQRAGTPPEPVRISEPVLVRAKDAALTAPAVNAAPPVDVATALVDEAVPVDEADPELAEYNRLLAWLAANPGSRPSDYRRATG
jgi:DNA-binding transcriptional regulator of glucitol operon